MKRSKLILAALAGLVMAGSASAAGGAKHPHGPEGGFPFEGPFGRFEQDSVQRGYQVYREVCASCHSMKLLSYRNLGEPGGPFYDEAYPNANDNPLVKAFAAQDEILSTEPNDVGDYEYRPARPADAFRSPYPNDAAARAANGGALPPDLSVITKARHGGAAYIYDLLLGYPDPEEINADGEIDFHDKYHGTLTQAPGQYYNPYMPGDTVPAWDGDPRHAPPGGFLAMAPQLMDGRVTYMDGTEATKEQIAYDVAQFLAWAGEPKQTNRKSAGLAVMAYLLIFAGLLWFSYKRIWRNVSH